MSKFILYKFILELLQIYDKEQDDVVKLKLLNNETRKKIAD